MSKDDIWKRLIGKFFKDFTSFFMSDLHNDIDFESGYTFLDKELSKISAKSKRKKRIADKLIQVKLKDGLERWVLVHIEVQGYLDEHFSSRMYKYQYRAYDKYDKNVIAIAIFIDKDENYKPDNFLIDLYGTKLTYKYNVYKILEQKGREKELIKSNNPFALIVLSSLYLLEAKTSEKKKLNFKIKLIQLLFSKNYSDEYILELLDFIDVLISLNKELNRELFDLEVKKMAKLKDKEELIGDLKKVAITKIAIEMKKNNEPIEKIIKYTHLTRKEIEKL